MHHSYKLKSDNVADQFTLDFLQDAKACYEAMFQATTVLGTWLELRVASWIKIWLPARSISQAQIYNPNNKELQTRSWDIVIHEPLPTTHFGVNLPPAATPRQGYPLVPIDLCYAAIDTKGRFNSPKKYAEKTAFNIRNDAQEKQLSLLKKQFTPMLFVLASTRNPVEVEKEGSEVGIDTFVVAHAKDLGLIDGKVHVEWTPNVHSIWGNPINAFKKKLVSSAKGE